MCLTPLTLKRPKEEWMLDVGGTTTRIVPCNKCDECRKRRSADWAFRIAQEQKCSTSSQFITLTYEKTPITNNGFQTLEKNDFKGFMKRLRNYESQTIKYYACGEYGTRYLRPHYHLILFNLSGDITNKLEKSWKNGLIDIGKAEPASIRYVTNYIQKSKWQQINQNDDRSPEFSLMSKGLGKSYLTPQMVNYHRKTGTAVLTKSGGQLQAMPRYYREKIFTKPERATIAHEMREISNLDIEKAFGFSESAKHIQWKKDQVRKYRKQEQLERLSL